MSLLTSCHVRVPATSANLGPGYDCLGLAVGLWLTVTATLAEEDRFDYEGEGSLPDTPHNLSHQGFAAVYRELGLDVPAVALKVNNPVPLARGLGSSSAALVAGAACADTLLGGRLGRDAVFQLCARLEGHPDNVAPAVFGGFTVSAWQDDAWISRSVPLPAGWNFLFALPDAELPTLQARKVVPEQFHIADVISTAARTALWALAVAQSDADLLKTATRDVLHQPYREPLLPGFRETLAASLDAGAYAAYLSGAGPSVAAICGTDELQAVSAALSGYGRVLQLPGAGGFEVSGQPSAP